MDGINASPVYVTATPDGYNLRTTEQHLGDVEALLAAYKRETDLKLADQHTELVSLRTQFRKLYDAVQHIGEPPFTMPQDDWTPNE